MTYEEWFNKKVNPEIVLENLSLKNFGELVARAVFRGDITEYPEKNKPFLKHKDSEDGRS